MAMSLSIGDRNALVWLLVILKDHVESSIKSNLVAGTNEPDPADTAEVEIDRRVWKEAEAMIKKLMVVLDTDHPL
jgi:hypothetical protein